MAFNKVLQLSALVCAAGILGGCVSTRLSDIESWESVPEDQVVLAGSLSHGYDTSDWDITWPPIFAILNYSVDFDEINEPNVDNIRQPEWGETFRISIDRNSQLLIHRPAVEGTVRSAGVETDFTYELPSILVNVPVDAQALYIGEIHYEPRRGTPNTVDVTINDDFDRVAAEFYAVMGSDVPLIRAEVRVFTTEEEETLLRYIEENYR